MRSGKGGIRAEPGKSVEEDLMGISAVLVDKQAMRIDLFGDIGINFVVKFKVTFDDLVAKARKTKRRIRINVFSFGGSSSFGLAIYDLIKTSGVAVDTVTLGAVGSSALAIYLAGQRRYIYENAILFSHPTDENIDSGAKLTSLKNKFAQLAVDDNAYRRIILANSKLTRQTLAKLERNETYITAEMAIKYGLAHEIIRNQ